VVLLISKGLGRYGDPIDGRGDLKAMRNLERVIQSSVLCVKYLIHMCLLHCIAVRCSVHVTYLIHMCDMLTYLILSPRY